MEYIYVGNNLFIKFNFKRDYLERYRFSQTPKINRATAFNDKIVELYVESDQNTYDEDIRVELQIYNPELKQCNMRITKDNGQFVDFFIKRKMDKIFSFGNNGDFVLVSKSHKESPMIKEKFGHCKLQVTTWQLSAEHTSMFCSNKYCNVENVGFLPVQRTQTNGGQTCALDFDVAVAGKSSQHFTQVAFGKRIEESKHNKYLFLYLYF